MKILKRKNIDLFYQDLSGAIYDLKELKKKYGDSFFQIDKEGPYIEYYEEETRKEAKEREEKERKERLNLINLFKNNINKKPLTNREKKFLGI